MLRKKYFSYVDFVRSDGHGYGWRWMMGLGYFGGRGGVGGAGGAGGVGGWWVDDEANLL